MVTSEKLVKKLTKLGVSPEQASGGVGTLLGLAKNNLSPENYTKITDAVFPDLNDIMKKTENMGINTGSVKTVNDAAESFTKLGMKPSDVEKFIPAIIKYTDEKAGPEISSLLKGALK
jgi:hypothetical protein